MGRAASWLLRRLRRRARARRTSPTPRRKPRLKPLLRPSKTLHDSRYDLSPIMTFVGQPFGKIFVEVLGPVSTETGVEMSRVEFIVLELLERDRYDDREEAPCDQHKSPETTLPEKVSRIIESWHHQIIFNGSE